MAEKEQEKADGGWIVKALAALVPSAISAISVAYVTLELVKHQVEKLTVNDSQQAEVLAKHTSELAVLNERMALSIKQLTDIVSTHERRLDKAAEELAKHRYEDSTTRRNR